jgi:hypothetical protein
MKLKSLLFVVGFIPTLSFAAGALMQLESPAITSPVVTGTHSDAQLRSDPQIPKQEMQFGGSLQDNLDRVPLNTSLNKNKTIQSGGRIITDGIGVDKPEVTIKNPNLK